jgi:hypothetical protein
MTHESRGRRRFIPIGLLILGVTSIVALAALVMTSIEKASSGRGLETYRTFWLVEFNAIGFLVLIAAVVVALSGAGVMWYLERRQIRELQRRYGSGHDG